MRSLVLLLSALIIAPTAPIVAARTVAAVKTGPGLNEGRTLPQTAEGATEQYGRLSDGQIKNAEALLGQIIQTADSGKAWGGPPLFSFRLRSDPMKGYSPQKVAGLKGVLNGATTYDPMSLGQDKAEAYGVIVAKLYAKPNMVAEWLAVVFVYDGDRVKRVVFNHQPWIMAVKTAVNDNFGSRSNG